MIQVGIISDTHGLVRPEAVRALRGCDRILHAGDVGQPDVLTRLAAIAHVDAVRGNVDWGEWASGLPGAMTLRLGSHRIHLLHNIAELGIDPAQTGIDVVVFGHSHKPKTEEKGGVLYVNPGSAGPRRFQLPVVLARMNLSQEKVDVEFVKLA